MRPLPTVWSCCLLLVLAGCAGLPPAPVTTPGAGAKRAAAPGMAPGHSPRFTLRAGDELDVELVTLPPANHRGLMVDGQGRLAVPGLGAIEVGGLDLTGAEIRITRLLQTTLDRTGRARLRLARSAGQRATVLGAVVRQGAIEVVPGMRVSSLVAAAGGPLSTPHPATGAPIVLADLSTSVLIRDGRRLPVDFAHALLGDPRHDVHVRPGDHLYLGLFQHPQVSVSGQVEGPTALAYHRDLRLSEAVAVAGGITVGGDLSDIRIVRGPTHAPRVYQADFEAIRDGQAPDIPLQPGDHIFVTDDPVEDAGEVFGVFAPFVGLAATAVTLSLVLNP